MNRTFASALAAALLAGLVTGAAAQTETQAAGPAPSEREAERRELEEAQRKLEEAAREVARLSAELSGPLVRELRRIQVGSPGRAMLGVNIGRAEPGTNGVRVLSVSPGGPAAEAGVVAGDLIVGLNDKRLGSGRDLVEGMRQVEPGDRVKLGILRGKESKDVFIIARAAEDLLYAGEPGIPVPGAPGFPRRPHHPHFLLGPWGGAELVAVTPKLGRYFGTDKGLLVVRAPDAADGGIEEGDVILSIGGREPQDAGHALRILGSYQPGESVSLEVMRDRQRRSVTLKIPEHQIGRSRVRPGVPPPSLPG